MPSKLSALEPVLNQWLELNVRYGGTASAEFSSPQAAIEGSGTATFDSYGNASIEIQPESFCVDSQYAPFGLMGVLSGSKVEESEGRKSLGFGGFHNPCQSLSIATPAGIFSSTGAERLTRWTADGREQKPLQFYVREARFETPNSNAPKYFAIPLFNCLAELGDGLVGPHPLRIYQTPQIPPDLSAQDQFFAKVKANGKNNVVGFWIAGKLCFLERLPDYEDRVTSLKNGVQRTVTAILVGELPNHRAATLSELWSWFPFELFSALSFASGAEVGLPWIEIRDEEGGLIRRLHGRSSLPNFWDGDTLLGQFDRARNMSGLGWFLTSYLSLDPRKRACLEVAMDHARLGTLGAPLRLYDILDHLIRALECLCRERGFTEQNLLLGLADHTRQEVRSAISQVTNQIRRLQDAANAAGLLDQHRLLGTIQGRAANIATTEKKFGLAVVSLLDSFGFPDADILDRSLASHPRKDGLRDWASIVTSYRGATIHEGYMDFERKHDVDDVVKICNHLKDVIARMVLKESGYDGTYQSPLLRGFGPQSIDWMQPATTADKLGFS